MLVIDEAQDMSGDEFALVHALMTANEEMRVIAVGDDDQNIYEFRGSDSCYMQKLAQTDGSRFVEMTYNYRSSRHVVDVSNCFARNIRNRLKHTEIESMNNDDGWVSVHHYQSDQLYTPLVNELISNRNIGSTCVLTQTNEEAVILVALMAKNGIRCKLVQSMSGIRFCNLAEMRYFLKYIDRRITSPLISNDLWEAAKQSTYSTYEESESLVFARKCIELFEMTNKTTYISDFKEYVFESNIEDFSDHTSSDVVVSTIHKAKGQEFDDVYMLVTRGYTHDDQLMRKYYVGITRAKKRLFIHTNSSVFDKIQADRHIVDQQQYDMPKEVVLQMSHKDVFLNYFKPRKKTILALRGGHELKHKNKIFLYDTTGHTVVMFSARMQQTLSEWQAKGYEIESGKVRFIVAWKPKDSPKEEQETAVVLADLRLVKKE